MDIQHEDDKVLHQTAIEEVVQEVLNESGGGGSGGLSVVGPFTITHSDSAALVDGKMIGYTPTPGDLIIDIFVRFPIVFDGGADEAQFHWLGTAIDNFLGVINSSPSLGNNDANDGGYFINGHVDVGTDVKWPGVGSGISQSPTWFPLLVVNNEPIIAKIGKYSDGTAIDETSGQMDIYFLVATPVVP